MNILGISAFYHDSAAALIRDGEIIAAAQEERFSRKKHDERFPVHAVRYCLREAGVKPDELDAVAFYDKPITKFVRILKTYFSVAPQGLQSFMMAMPIWMREKLWIPLEIEKSLELCGITKHPTLYFPEHHESHAASAFYASPYQRAAILTIDGVGEWATTTLGRGNGHDLEILYDLHFPHSLGLLYSAFTYFTGFRVNSGEYKVMGLAPYGEPVYADLILDKLLDVRDDGSFRMDMSYFNYTTGLTMTNDRFAKLFGEPRREPADPLTDFHMNIARSVQAVAEKLIMGVCAEAHRLTGSKNLCLAGGVALNCVANGLIQREGPFENIWIQPASGDAGSALGIALAAANLLGDERVPPRSNGADAMHGSYLGPSYTDDEIRTALDEYGAVYERLDDDKLTDTVADTLAEDKIVGWFQGRMEFGPRALGNRSILGNPASASMQKTLNMKIKYRESFRPFAPAVLREDAAEHFKFDADSPYMLIVAPVRDEDRLPLSEDDRNRAGLDRLNVVRAKLPAITHVDYSARIQTVTPDSNKRFYDLIRAFKSRTGSGVLVNTSFNVRDEPVVCTPADAYRCFMATEMDMLAVGNFVLRKDAQ